ncbi:hypothetical protein H696_01911 [Fonticula alba]|uniref:Importin N-terminal domain-containing protein n=1 Tax=Fonticula alba TaxID=691883 RepID=A0A058Z9K9_FONAL|nr:hypothetical protein H696_01911 [Fonticula alba]KCV70964.1 hypothetical protein H696_01911 [Fonticula alba]|eukprot:XP_009494087.1 hypothetical protein H696_01911 [Fonticula alba]
MLGMIAGVWRNNFYVHRIPEKPVHSRVVNSTQKKERHVGFVRARVAAFWTPERVEYFCSTILIGPLITLRERDRALWADSPVDFFIEDSSQLAQHFVRPAAEHLLQTAIEQFGTLIFPKILQLYHQSSGPPSPPSFIMSFMGTPVPPIYAPLLELLLAAAHATSTDALRGITAKFEELSGQPGYCLALSMALANTELTSVVRQHAAVALKNRLQVAWRAVGSDAIPEEEKNAIRSILLETIFDPSDQRAGIAPRRAEACAGPRACALPAGADAESSLDAIWCALQLAAISPSSRHEFRFSSLLDSTRLHTLRSSNLLKRRFCLMIPQWIEFGLDAPLRPLMIGELVSQTAPAEDLAVRLYASQALAACIADYDFDFETQLQPYLTPALRHLLGLCLEVSSRSLEALATVLAVLSTLIEAVGAAPASTPVLLEHVDALQELLWGLWSWATGSNGAAPPGSVGGVAGGPAGPVAAPVPADSGPDGGASHGAAIQVAVLAFVGKTVSALSQHRTMLAGLRPGPETAGAGAAGPASGAAVDRPLQVILDFCVRELIPRSILAPAAEQQQQQLLEEGTSLWLTVMEASEQLTEPLGALFALLVPMPTPLERFFEGQHQVESPALVFHDSENAEVAMSILRAYVHFRAPFLVRADSPAGAGLRNALAELLRLYVIQPGLALRALDAATAGGPDGAPLDEAAAAAAAAAAAETASDGSVAARVALVSGVAQVLEALMLSVLLGPHPGVAPALGGGSPPALGQFVAWFSHGDATSPSLLNVLLQSIDISSSEARLFRPILLPLVARLFLEFGTWPTAYRLAGLADTSSPHLASQALVHFITIVQDSWDSLSTPFQFRLLGLFAIRLAQDILLPPGAQSAEVQAMPQLHRLVEELLTMSASSISFMHRAQLESKREAADRRGAVSALSGAGAEDNYANGEDDEEDDDYYHRSAAPTPNAIRQGEIAQSDQLSSQSLRTSLLSCLRVLVAHEAQQRQQSQGASPGDSVYDIILAKLEES